MWDQHDRKAPLLGPFRIIPTYVGSTGPWKEGFTWSTNHSHVCGINGRDDRSDHDDRRIIPTYVGSTGMQTLIRPDPSNHSHVCGINPAFQFFEKVPFESFPRMWDQHRFRVKNIRDHRIIPTYVGSTFSDALMSFYRFESFPRMWDQLMVTTEKR